MSYTDAPIKDQNSLNKKLKALMQTKKEKKIRIPTTQNLEKFETLKDSTNPLTFSLNPEEYQKEKKQKMASMANQSFKSYS